LSISTEYSLWFVLLCLAVAAAGSWFLYQRNTLDLSGKYGKWMLRGLMAFRFLSLFFVAFLLLGPLMKIWSRRTDKPFIIFAIDGSQSIVAGKDSSFYKTTFKNEIEALQNSLGNDYEIKTYQFGKSLTNAFDGNYSEKQTNVSQVFDEIKNNYSNQNLGAIVLATDGLYNEGNNPLYTAREIKSPVFTVALGDTIQQKDLLIRQVKHNQIVYTGNIFPLQIDVSAYGYPGQKSIITVNHKGQNIFSQSVNIIGASFFTTIPISLDAKEAGTQHYIITVSALPGEVSVINNRYDVFVNIIDGKQKIAMVSYSPHPDLTAYKQAIEQNENYNIATLRYDKISPAELKDYSLVIFHQIPGPRGEGSNLVKEAKDLHVPILYVLGAQTGLSYFNTLEPTMNILATRSANNEVIAGFQPGFSLFTLGDDELEVIKKFPPLISPYGTYKYNAESEILFTQQIGYVKTNYPLMLFSKSAGNKVGFICGEGFWKWRMYDAGLSEQKVTSSLAGKLVQYLAAKEDRSRFRINGNKRFDENEPIRLDAEVYNESYELINSVDVQIVIRNAQGKKYNYSFSKTGNAYTLDAGLLPVGNYSYEASAAIGNKVQNVKGQFAVVPLQVEFLQTTADHQLLNEIATETGGKLFSPSQLSELEKTLRSNETIKPVIYKQEDLKSWINLKWIFFTILALLSVEWFIRKWNGSI
jgi:hypothetical protein